MSFSATTLNEIPRLDTLAANALKKSNPHLFFTFYNHKILPADLENSFVNPPINQIVEECQRAHLSRDDNVNKYSASLSKDRCFGHGTSLLGSAFTSSVHVGIYFILRASNVSSATTFTFLATIPLTVVLGICMGVCFTRPAAKALAKCLTPGVAEVIDLNDLVELEAQKKQADVDVPGAGIALSF